MLAAILSVASADAHHGVAADAISIFSCGISIGSAAHLIISGIKVFPRGLILILGCPGWDKDQRRALDLRPLGCDGHWWFLRCGVNIIPDRKDRIGASRRSARG